MYYSTNPNLIQLPKIIIFWTNYPIFQIIASVNFIIYATAIQYCTFVG